MHGIHSFFKTDCYADDFYFDSTPVYAEVETRIGALRSLLLEKLLQTPSTLHDQKRYIRSLYKSVFFFACILCEHPAKSPDSSLHSLWLL